MLNPNLKKVKQRGYSLVELITTIVLSSIAIVIFYNVFFASQSQSVTPIFQVKAARLGQAYLEEIMLRRFDENSPVGNALRCNAPTAPSCSAALGSDGETRQNYDDVDDYNGLLDSPPEDAAGNMRSGFNNFTVSVTVSYAGAELGLANTDLKKIEVSVTPPNHDGTAFIFSQYRGNF